MTTGLEPIKKTVDLRVSQEKAFGHFTNNIHNWWPMHDHSLSGERTKTVIFEQKEGGRLYEVDNDGREREWGRVKVCDPCERLVFSWVLEEPELATEVEIRFESVDDAKTRMTLIHRGWEKRPNGLEWRKNYNVGWDGVIACYRRELPDS